MDRRPKSEDLHEPGTARKDVRVSGQSFAGRHSDSVHPVTASEFRTSITTLTWEASSASAVLGQFLRSLFFEVRPADPLTFASVAILLAVVALLAAYIPARRATRVDPLVALRHE